MPKVQFTNGFHGTRASVMLATFPGYVSRDALNRARKSLCGLNGCKCTTVAKVDGEEVNIFPANRGTDHYIVEAT